MPRVAPRAWQQTALSSWEQSNYRGIVSVVTGGGKTVFALSCIDKVKPNATLVIVPTTALLEQWWEETASYFDMALDEINIISGTRRLRLGTVNIAVLNTAATLADRKQPHPCFLIVDECHKAASEQFRRALSLPTVATLGLSATPERPYDDGLRDVLIPALGPVIFTYDYADALRDGVIVPFTLKNIVFEMEEDRQKEYDKLSKAIARSIDKLGFEAEQTVALLLKRSRVLNLSMNRIRLALRIAGAHRGERTLIFHEDIEACEVIHAVLRENGFQSGVYHSRMPLRQKALVLAEYRRGDVEVLVTCRALDEGFNVPETQVGIIAASTATLRQRIQRLGRVVRPALGKDSAQIYTLVATKPEIERLKMEEERLEGVAKISWSLA